VATDSSTDSVCRFAIRWRLDVMRGRCLKSLRNRQVVGARGTRLTSSGRKRIGTTARGLVELSLLSLLLSACHFAPKAPTLSAGTLLREYQQSRNDARQKYDGKEISVRGLAQSAATLPLDGADEGSVWLQESVRDPSGKVGCWFSSQQAADFSKIVSGQHVTIKGVFNGEAGVELKFCRLLKVE